MCREELITESKINLTSIRVFYILGANNLNVLHAAELLRIKANSKLNPKVKSTLGQFFTPHPISLYMASLFNKTSYSNSSPSTFDHNWQLRAIVSPIV